jgi:hypothetical protein
MPDDSDTRGHLGQKDRGPHRREVSLHDEHDREGQENVDVAPHHVVYHARKREHPRHAEVQKYGDVQGDPDRREHRP